jgi:hypothetical protein
MLRPKKWPEELRWMIASLREQTAAPDDDAATICGYVEMNEKEWARVRAIAQPGQILIRQNIEQNSSNHQRKR